MYISSALLKEWKRNQVFIEPWSDVHSGSLSSSPTHESLKELRVLLGGDGIACSRTTLWQLIDNVANAHLTISQVLNLPPVVGRVALNIKTVELNLDSSKRREVLERCNVLRHLFDAGVPQNVF